MSRPGLPSIQQPLYGPRHVPRPPVGSTAGNGGGPARTRPSGDPGAPDVSPTGDIQRSAADSAGGSGTTPPPPPDGDSLSRLLEAARSPEFFDGPGRSQRPPPVRPPPGVPGAERTQPSGITPNGAAPQGGLPLGGGRDRFRVPSLLPTSGRLPAPSGGRRAPVTAAGRRVPDHLEVDLAGPSVTRLPVGGAARVAVVSHESIERAVAAAVSRRMGSEGDDRRPLGPPNKEIIFRQPDDAVPAKAHAPKVKEEDPAAGTCWETEDGLPVGMDETEKMIAAIEDRVLAELERRGGRFAEAL